MLRSEHAVMAQDDEDARLKAEEEARKAEEAEEKVARLKAKKSWRPPEFADRHSLSTSQIYEEVREGRLNARKVGAATIITEEDETAWLKALPPFASHRSPSPKRKPAASAA
jgi:hypothetical protein